MPVRSLRSSVFKWPGRDEVEKALRVWARTLKDSHPEVLRVGYFGSYASSSWGVGSDLDVVVVVEASTKPFMERPRDFDTTSLPVPVDLLVYTQEELERLEGRFARVLKEETVWVL